tara:strand:- start:772 stop:1404 length:633 start_codon:yes stop_codon:yes gene_type:complete
MARIVQGDDSTFNALALGELHPNTQQFLSAQMEAPTHNLTTQGQSFFQNTRSLFERLEDSRAARLVKAAQRAIGSIWQNDGVRLLSTIGNFQWATNTMQRWVMAQPEVRKMYHEQRLEGYSGQYRDAYPTDIGESHYDYRRATNGFVFVKDNPADDEPEYTATTYYDDLDPSENELDLLEQVDIVDSWENVVNLIRHGKDDPTSRFNASL